MNAVLAWTVQTCLVVLLILPVVLILCRLFRRHPGIQHLLWVALFLKFLTPSIVVWPWQIPLRPLTSAIITEPVAESSDATRYGQTLKSSLARLGPF
jgi:hypothetical protein